MSFVYIKVIWPATLLTLHILQCSCTVCGRSQCLLSQPPTRPTVSPPNGSIDAPCFPVLRMPRRNASDLVRPRPFPDGGGEVVFPRRPSPPFPPENVLVACREEKGLLSLTTKEGGYHIPSVRASISRFRTPQKKIPGVEGSSFLTTAVVPLFARSVSHPCRRRRNKESFFLFGR